MRNTVAKRAFIVLTFNVTLISCMEIPKEDALFKTRPNHKVNVSCVGLVYFQSLVGLRLLLVIYLMN